MTHSYSVVEVSSEQRHDAASKKLDPKNGPFLAIGERAERIMDGIEHARLKQPAVTRLAKGRLPEREYQLSLIETAATCNLPSLRTTLVIPKYPPLAEVTCVYLFNLRSRHRLKAGGKLLPVGDLFRDPRQAVWFKMLIGQAHCVFPEDISPTELPPPPTVLDALQYACMNSHYSIEDRTAKIGEFLHTGLFTGWREERLPVQLRLV